MEAATTLERSLIEAISEFEIIDAHEHLPPEEERVERAVDVFTLFSHYTRGDLYVAGMSAADYESLFDTRIPLDRRWELFAPYWTQILYGSYARAALLAAAELYDCREISDQTYVALSERMQGANRAGIYHWVLREKCRIRVALTQCGRTDLGTPLLKPVMPMLAATSTWRELVHMSPDGMTAPRTLDDYLQSARQYITRVRDEGAVGLKIIAAPFGEPDRRAAAEAFADLQSGCVDALPANNPLRDYAVEDAIAFATEQDMVICVHTGYWGDFRSLDPLHMIPVLQRHPNARFDMYHLGYPWVRESLMLGKGFPNVWLNLCWTHIISQEFATSALDEAIDLIPMNKLIAFGGDYGMPVEKVYGHLVMAREDIARVLARRIVAGGISESQALDLAHRWLWDNPRDLYRLRV